MFWPVLLVLICLFTNVKVERCLGMYSFEIMIKINHDIQNNILTDWIWKHFSNRLIKLVEKHALHSGFSHPDSISTAAAEPCVEKAYLLTLWSQFKLLKPMWYQMTSLRCTYKLLRNIDTSRPTLNKSGRITISAFTEGTKCQRTFLCLSLVFPCRAYLNVSRWVV